MLWKMFIFIICLLCNTLILRLTFSNTGKILEWIEHYLSDHTQWVKLDDNEFKLVKPKHGIPQSSVLGPILFPLYTSPLGDIYRKHGVKYHCYADDTQNYLSFKPNVTGNQEECIWNLELCITEIRKWMWANLLKFNDDKTEFLLAGTKLQLNKNNSLNVKIRCDEIKPVSSIRNHGFHQDAKMKMLHM